MKHTLHRTKLKQYDKQLKEASRSVKESALNYSLIKPLAFPTQTSPDESLCGRGREGNVPQIPPVYEPRPPRVCPVFLTEMFTAGGNPPKAVYRRSRYRRTRRDPAGICCCSTLPARSLFSGSFSPRWEPAGLRSASDRRTTPETDSVTEAVRRSTKRASFFTYLCVFAR